MPMATWPKADRERFSDTILIVSDLHLGDRSSADDFRANESLFRSFLSEVAPSAAGLVLAGDILELWQMQLERVLMAYTRLIRDLLALAHQIPVTYVVGNHDWFPFCAFIGAQLGGITFCEEYQVTECRLLVRHGHQWDTLTAGGCSSTKRRGSLNAWGLSFISWVSRQVTRLVGWWERIDPDIDERLGDVGGSLRSWWERYVARAPSNVTRLSPVPGLMPDSPAPAQVWASALAGLMRHHTPGKEGYSEAAADRYQQAAARLVADDGQALVVLGHTHVPRLVRLPGSSSEGGDSGPPHGTIGSRPRCGDSDRPRSKRGLYVNAGSWAFSRYPPTFVAVDQREQVVHLVDARTLHPINTETFSCPAPVR